MRVLSVCKELIFSILIILCFEYVPNIICMWSHILWFLIMVESSAGSNHLQKFEVRFFLDGSSGFKSPEI